MNRKTFICFLFFLAFFLKIYSFDFHLKKCARHAITYEVPNGRLGDCLLSYINARYLSFVTSTKFIYKKFNHFDKFELSCLGHSFDQLESTFDDFVSINNKQDLNKFFETINNPYSKRTLFTLGFFTFDHTEWNSTDSKERLLFNINWNEADFHSLIKKSLVPSISIPTLCKPNALNVALHVRKFSGTDPVDYVEKFYPLKSPPIEYHIKVIDQILKMHNQSFIYVFVFSDYYDILSLVNLLKERFSGKNIEFGARDLRKVDTDYVVEDLFAMQKFDVLVATRSNFSMTAARLGNYEMVFFPESYEGLYPNIRINKIQLITRSGKFFPFKCNLILGN